eukprot:TRINITY_DN21453_c0_g1_i1.p1 TRINITY_DN21453_c0_g1~~TRINITY_DN21453_c0_g1_i1.p1  ORF type:complete len:234 (+),score=56.20 TRINITY_DN21453_c0_g1_i1:44-703(+)
MLRRVAVLRFVGGVPKVPESKEEQKDALNFIQRSEYTEFVAKEQEVRWMYPKDWTMNSTEQTTNGEGFVVKEFMMRPQNDTDRPVNAYLRTAAFTVLCTKLPEIAVADMSKGHPAQILDKWFQGVVPLWKEQNFTDIQIQFGPPCTLIDEIPHGALAYSTMKYQGMADELAVNYWRLFQNSEKDRFCIASYTGSGKTLEDHLAQRWYGLNLLQNVEYLW